MDWNYWVRSSLESETEAEKESGRKDSQTTSTRKNIIQSRPVSMHVLSKPFNYTAQSHCRTEFMKWVNPKVKKLKKKD